ncbi:M28 family metallopeptidase [Ekhidna sp.]|uniref:M28 family metallopeptidase n=1 Tax=Ekhidna sp. TaxID=2608089 RepID=UPI003CCC2E3A
MLAGQHEKKSNELHPFQENVIKVLTGMIPYESTSFLNDRSTPSGRKISSEILWGFFDELGLESQSHDYTSSHPMIFPDLFFGPARGTNIYAILESNPKNDYVVIGAHYDAEPGSPGAGDNASGVALVASLAKILKAHDALPFNYIFVFFDQEEDNELGSKAFAEFIEEKEWGIHSVHVTDLAGWDKDGDGAVIIQTSNKYMKEIYLKASKKLQVEIRITSGGSSDNKSFQRVFPTVGVFGDITKHLHKPTDTYETVDFEFLTLMTRLMSEVLVTLDK